MNTINSNNSGAIQLSETFTRLLTGDATMGDIIAERRAARTATLGCESRFEQRRREFSELLDCFSANFAH